MGFVRKDSIIITLLTYFGLVIGYFNKVLLFTNFLTTEQVGLANILIFIASLYAQVSALGSINIVFRFFPFFKSDENKHFGFLFFTNSITAIGFILVSTVFIIFNDFFASIFNENSPLLVEYSLLIIPMSLGVLFYNFFETYLRSLQKNIVSTIANEIICRLGITFSISLFALGLIDFKQFIYLYVAINCTPALIVILYTIYKKQFFIKPEYNQLIKRLWKIMIVYGLYSTLNNVSYILIATMDSLMVAKMLDLGSTGIYTTIIFLANLLLIPWRSLVKVSLPTISSLWKKRDLVTMEENYKKSSLANLIFSSYLFLMIWVNIDSLFSFMSAEYYYGKYVFLFLGIGRIVEASSGINGAILLTSKKFRIDLFFTIGLVVFTYFTNLIFIPIWGINGAAFATLLTITIFISLRIYYVRKAFKIFPFQTKQIFIVIIILLNVTILSLIPDFSNVYFNILFRSVICTSLSLFPIYFLKISLDFNNIVNNLLKKFLRK